MQLFLVFILQIISIESHREEINYVLYNIVFHSHLPHPTYAHVFHLCSAHLKMLCLQLHSYSCTQRMYINPLIYETT